MANEISVTAGLRVRNGLSDESFLTSGVQLNQSQQGSVGGILSIGTTTETIMLGDVVTAGYGAFRNLSTATSGTAYIAVGHYDGTNLQEVMHLRRGQPAVLPLAKSITLAAKSYGATLPLRFVVFAE